MGVVNVTPDSFSDGGQWFDHDRAVSHGRDLIAQGADVIDVGGESTRPGAQPVSEDEELRRVVPVIAQLAPLTRVSVDTRKPRVAEAAIEAGATIVNDTSAALWPVAAAGGVGWIAMHMRGEPATMTAAAHYSDVVSEVRDYLVASAEAAAAGGVREVWIDPGIGFAKNAEHNLALLANLRELVATGWPVVVGTSRKSFIGRILAGPNGDAGPEDRLEGSLATASWAMTQGVSMVRVHDVAPTANAARLMGDGAGVVGR